MSNCYLVLYCALQCLGSCWVKNLARFIYFLYICLLVLAASNCIGVPIANKCHPIKININYCMKHPAVNPSRIIAAPKHLDFILGLAIKRNPLWTISVYPLNSHYDVFIPNQNCWCYWIKKITDTKISSYIYILLPWYVVAP
jgi:hypothetical protein